MENKTKTGNYNRYADEMLNKIEACIQERMKKIPSLETAVVDSVNTDGTINIYFPPNRESVFTRISNQTPFILTSNDTVEVIKKGGSWNNCWIIAKHGATHKENVETN